MKALLGSGSKSSPSVLKREPFLHGDAAHHPRRGDASGFRANRRTALSHGHNARWSTLHGSNHGGQGGSARASRPGSSLRSIRRIYSQSLLARGIWRPPAARGGGGGPSSSAATDHIADGGEDDSDGEPGNGSSGGIGSGGATLCETTFTIIKSFVGTMDASHR